MATKAGHFIPVYVPVTYTAMMEADWLYPALARFMDAYAVDDTAQWKPYWTGIDVVESITIYYPGSDITISGWSPYPDATVYTTIDEDPYSDTDYVLSPYLGTGSPVTMGLTNSLIAGNYEVDVRASTTGYVGQLRIHLVDDTDTIQGTSNWQSVTPSLTTYTLSITTTGTTTRIRIEVQA